jgi:hypothetical protein
MGPIHMLCFKFSIHIQNFNTLVINGKTIPLLDHFIRAMNFDEQNAHNILATFVVLFLCYLIYC